MHCSIKNFSRSISLHVVILFCLLSSATHAESLSDDLTVNGFFTFDATYTDKTQPLISSSGDFRQYNKQNVGFKNSLVGAQVNYQVSRNLNFYVQGIATYDGADKFDTRLDWAYLSYDLGDDAYLRGGQFQIPFLQGTELRSVGMSRIWARPLIPGSGAGGFKSYQGLEYLKHFATNNSYWDIQLGLGKAEHHQQEVDNKNIQLVSLRYTYDSFWLRAALIKADYAVYTIRKALITDSANVVMGSVEVEWTINQFIFNGGYSTSRADITPDDTMHYLSLAYQLGDFTPYIFTSLRNQYFETFVPPTSTPEVSVPWNSPPPTNRPPFIPDGDADSRSYAIGLRWSVSEHLAVKTQFENVQVRDEARNPMAVITSNSNAFTLTFEGTF
jgi:hypothetical protein